MKFSCLELCTQVKVAYYADTYSQKQCVLHTELFASEHTKPLQQYRETNKTQAAALESVVLGAKHILGGSSRTCNEAVRGIWDWILYKVIGIRPS